MMNLNFIFDILKSDTQEIIDALALKYHDLAEENVIKLSEKIDDLIDNNRLNLSNDFYTAILKVKIGKQIKSIC